jgi:rubrerythrin
MTWTLNDIAWQRFDASKVSPDVLKVIKTAAMVERNGADYGRYLCNVFHDDAEFCALAESWAVEEEQHGLALGRWASLADPHFDFDKSFATFTGMYRIPVDSTTSVRGSRVGELCARAVVETATSSFYSAIRDSVDEPVLKDICKHIAADEFRHYKLFFSYMERYTAHAGNAIAKPYDREEATAGYGQRVYALYQERHVRRAGFMFAQAAGLKPDGLAAKVLVKVLWLFVLIRGRKFRPQFAASGLVQA